jgi:plasmid segregation protein ParM
MNLIDGYYFEIPTNVVELSEEAAKSYFVASINTPNELLRRLLISTTIRGEDKKRYFLVGEEAEKHLLANQHVNKLHDKINSHIPYVMFLAATAYYQALKGKNDESEVEIEYFSTMLPIWLLKRTNKFSEAQSAMADRFLGEHTVDVLTPGLERTLKINVLESYCRIEGEIARLALKKDLSLQDKEEAKQFENHDTVLVDIGGGTIDLVLLPAGLKPPKSRESMQIVERLSYLAHIDKLRKEKFLEYFSDLRSFEAFIVENYDKEKMELRDRNTGKSIDLTEQIRKSLKEYAKNLIEKIREAMPAPADKVYKYVYFGGVAPILKNAIKEVLKEEIAEDIVEENHIFPEDSRKLNLYGLEIRSLGELNKRKTTA